MSKELTLSHIKGRTYDVGQEVFAKRYVEQLSHSTAPLFRYVSSTSDAVIEMTVGEYHQAADAVASAMYTKAQVNRKDVIGVFLPNCIEYVIMGAAIEASGFIMMPFNPLFKAEQLAHFCNKVSPKLIVTSPEKIKTVLEADPTVKILVIKTPKEELKTIAEDIRRSDVLKNSEEIRRNLKIEKSSSEEETFKKFEQLEDQLFSYEEFLKTPIDTERLKFEREQILPHDVLFYGCTSGSTGNPKICVYENMGFTANIYGNSHNVPLEEKRVLLFAPLSTTTGHIAMDGMVIRSYYVVFTDKFDVEKIFKIIEENKVTNIGGAPPAFLALMKHPNRTKYNLSSLKEFVVGGAVASDFFMESLKKTFGLSYVTSGFGMTELCGVMYLMPVKSTKRVEGKFSLTAGPSANVEVRVVDLETREILPVGFSGELEVKSQLMMRCYLNNKEANDQAFTADGFFKTGDEVLIEKDGYMNVTGRVKEMIIRGGHNVWPKEICEVLNKHPRVQESAVIGIPDKVQGEKVVAFVLLKKGGNTIDNEIINSEIIEKELKSYLNERIVSFSIPTFIFTLPEFPRTSFGKVYLPKLREMVGEKIREKWRRAEELNDDIPRTEMGKEIAKVWSEFFEIPVGALSRKTDFFALGGDSFVGAQTIAYIRKVVKTAPFNLVNNKPTIGELEDYVLNPESTEGAGKEIKEDYEHLQISTFEEVFGNVYENVSSDFELRDSVVITGATGYLGVYLVTEACKIPTIKTVYCIGRSANQSELDKKMNTMLRHLALPFSTKIKNVIGDVSKPLFGMEQTVYSTLQEKTRFFIHSAAIVNWAKSYSQLKATNSVGVKNAIIFCGKTIPLCVISTIGAALDFNEEISARVPLNTFGYIQSKWMGEKYCEKALQNGCKVSLMRPVFICADSTSGICNTDDFIYKCSEFQF
ncbi:AMP dependent CoA ligase, putative [Entamoeba invadens IP1]|uniref:AMP dependent CoA ligase, putative n=1 Tax=Entamoeba invadens IP1 TaxID=370355 RepID=L7FQF6_ENTIV|nr:AMP dependent CoA ligase, putative [Entamoeba invadens IP1]ELP94509.1 AMP dependent CoA ligase, putative [Entamoeba invadens IP1]|eukprot:XP_004261280.1 AMP dependent CoA ligase, putative [Entamoeba invadens IP1]